MPRTRPHQPLATALKIIIGTNQAARERGVRGLLSSPPGYDQSSVGQSCCPRELQENGMAEIRTSARRARHSEAMISLARFGLAARAFIYLVIGVLAYEIARGHTAREADQG